MLLTEKSSKIEVFFCLPLLVLALRFSTEKVSPVFC